MNYKANTIDKYISLIPEERRVAFKRLHSVIKKNLPEGFSEVISYGSPAYIVPHSIYPAGYHCKPSEPLPFIAIACQKHFIGFYHMGVYANPDLLKWFQAEYAKLDIGKLDMGKSCVRFKNMNKIPYDLLGELVTKISVNEWIEVYESGLKS